jgi:hypothetical protein
MNNTQNLAIPSAMKKWHYGLILIGIIILSIGSGLLLPQGIDWHLTYRPVSLLAIQGKSPYSPDLPMPFPYAPWALLPILPLGLLPENIGRGAFFVLGIASYCLFALRLGANRITLPAFLLSPPVLHCLLNANLDFMPLVGYVLPPQIGLFFLVIKPQIGIGGILFWLYISWKKGGFKETVRVFAPVTVAILASFLVFGLWPLKFFQALSYGWNASLWPLSIPVAICLMVLALRHKEIRYSIAASPCFSPYVLFHSWAGVMGTVLSDTWLSLAAFAGLWAAIIVRALGA